MAKHTALDYTDAELLALWKQADADLAAGGQSKAIRGKTLTLADAAEVTAKIKFYESRISSATAGPSVSTKLSVLNGLRRRFGEPCNQSAR
jgi:hypothetical protein